MVIAAFILSIAGTAIALISALSADGAKKAAVTQAAAAQAQVDEMKEQTRLALDAAQRNAFRDVRESYAWLRDWLRSMSPRPDHMSLDPKYSAQALLEMFNYCEQNFDHPPYQGADSELRSFLSGCEPSIIHELMRWQTHPHLHLALVPDLFKEITQGRFSESEGPRPNA